MRGGYRENSGRKKGFSAKAAEEARQKFCELVADEIKPIAEVLIKKAKEGDVRVIKELLDRAWGRPAQEVTLPSGGISMTFDESFRDKSKAAISQYLNRK